MNRIIKNFLIPILFIFTVFLYGQDDCPDDLTMFQAPGEGEPGCMDYNDCNDNGAFDLGEPCYDAPPLKVTTVTQAILAIWETT